jgi:hypothetical protein
VFNQKKTKPIQFPSAKTQPQARVADLLGRGLSAADFLLTVYAGKLASDAHFFFFELSGVTLGMGRPMSCLRASPFSGGAAIALSFPSFVR